MSNEQLQIFVGGIWYFRFCSWDVGPDWHYLFRRKILSIDLDDDGTLSFVYEDLPLNRFKENEWVRHDTEHNLMVLKPCEAVRAGVPVLLPDFTQISPTIVYVRCDMVADSVLYVKEDEQPEDIHVFRDFPKDFEALAGLGGIK